MEIFCDFDLIPVPVKSGCSVRREWEREREREREPEHTLRCFSLLNAPHITSHGHRCCANADVEASGDYFASICIKVGHVWCLLCACVGDREGTIKATALSSSTSHVRVHVKEQFVLVLISTLCLSVLEMD